MKKKIQDGFTLIEIMLVLVITAMIIYTVAGYVQQKSLQMRMDRTSTQMQQILTAGLAYYVANGSWPVTSGTSADLSELQNNKFLPPSTVTIKNPWGTDYRIASDSDGKMFYVYTSITVPGTAGRAAVPANVIAGTLPLAYTTKTSGSPVPVAGTSCVTADTTCYIVSSVNMPGQDLTKSGSVNFAGLYRPGACVPVPVCPAGTTAQVMLTTVQVSGANNGYGSDPSTTTPDVYPISSFYAYARGPGANPAECLSNGAAKAACANNSSGSPTGNYWRACLKVTTSSGDVSADGWSGFQTLMAITRCAITGEKAGSTWDIHNDE